MSPKAQKQLQKLPFAKTSKNKFITLNDEDLSKTPKLIERVMQLKKEDAGSSI